MTLVVVALSLAFAAKEICSCKVKLAEPCRQYSHFLLVCKHIMYRILISTKQTGIITLSVLVILILFQRGLNIDYNADDTLNSFCSWQSVLVGPNGRQHDHAILLTGLDLCSYKNAPCDTLGKCNESRLAHKVPPIFCSRQQFQNLLLFRK